MKTSLSLRPVLCVLLSLLAAAAWGTVTIKGTIFYYDRGQYRPASNLLLQVEFAGLTLDDKSFTGPRGTYSVSHRDPLAGGLTDPLDRHWDVDVEIRASAQLGTYDPLKVRNLSGINPVMNDGKIVAACWSGSTSNWPYNGQTGSSRIVPGETRTIDVYIGGPKNTITSWDYGDDGKKTLLAVHMCEMVREAYLWATARGVKPEEVWRDTYLMYPKDKSAYKPFSPPPGTGHIEVAFNANNVDFGSSVDLDMLRDTIRHEYGHKIMHDIYWALPQSFNILDGSEHTLTTTTNAELGWKEGWAEFFTAAMFGEPLVGGNNIEVAWTPDVNALNGVITWRDKVDNTRRRMNEGENAAVLWDLLDGEDTEYFPQAKQTIPTNIFVPVSWRNHLTWHDRALPIGFGDIWSLLRDHGPDCLTDDGDVWQDSFWYYWLNHYGTDNLKVHQMKAFLYNRGITSSKKAEHAPTVQINNGPTTGMTTTLIITEPDPEDRPYLSYRLGYAQTYTPTLNSTFKEMFAGDKPLTGQWNGDKLTVTVSLPAPPQALSYVVLVHDDMETAFATYSSPKPATSTGTSGPSGPNGGIRPQ